MLHIFRALPESETLESTVLLDDPEFKSRWKKDPFTSPNIETSPGINPTSYSVSSKLKNERSYTSTSLMCLNSWVRNNF
jgi:hypothetical protein